MILDAVKNGAKKFVIGIGGSATNDGGAGMLQALGCRLLDAEGRDLSPGGAALVRLVRIDKSDFRFQISDFRSRRTEDEGQISDFRSCKVEGEGQISDFSFRIACDVTNPLCGPNGASAVFGPQKGATPEMVAELDAALAHFASVAQGAGVAQEASVAQGAGVARDSSSSSDYKNTSDTRVSSSSSNSGDSWKGEDVSRFPGAGAAGGLGFAFKAFLNAALVPGVDLILAETHLEDAIRDADVVITGEGRLDGQTVMGKAPIGVARLAKKHGKRVLAFCGCVGDGVEAVNAAGIDAYFPILRQVVTLDEALDVSTAAEHLSATVEQAFRLLRLNTETQRHRDE